MGVRVSFTSGKRNPEPVGYEAEWASEPVWIRWGRKHLCLREELNSSYSARSKIILTQLSYPLMAAYRFGNVNY
jgi:hypothetical protein